MERNHDMDTSSKGLQISHKVQIMFWNPFGRKQRSLASTSSLYSDENIFPAFANHAPPDLYGTRGKWCKPSISCTSQTEWKQPESDCIIRGSVHLESGAHLQKPQQVLIWVFIGQPIKLHYILNYFDRWAKSKLWAFVTGAWTLNPSPMNYGRF